MRICERRRGYADSEIEAVFAKYDSNGDRRLTEDDLAHMNEDLEKQQKQVGTDINKAEEKAKDADDKATLKGFCILFPHIAHLLYFKISALFKWLI